jgi:cohesin complex subunit SA-1/2
VASLLTRKADAIMNPSAALQSSVEDFLDSLSNNEGLALAELVNCMLRACGCNESVDEHEAIDFDGVVDKLDNITEVLKQVSRISPVGSAFLTCLIKVDTPIYPLTSKLAIFKKFRRSLLEFLERLVTSSADMGVLYSTDLIQTLQVWVAAMSSSQLRSFRHTATVVALQVETALCDVAANAEKEAEVVARQLDGEKKRSKGNAASKSKNPNVRSRELTQKADEVRERRSKITELLDDLTNG